MANTKKKPSNVTKLPPDEEEMFQIDYADYSKATGMNPDPDKKEHYYDYRGLWKTTGELPGPGEHGDSRFKLPGHPRTYVNPKTDEGSETPKAGFIKTKAKGGVVRTASARADGCAIRGKTRA